MFFPKIFAAVPLMYIRGYILHLTIFFRVPRLRNLDICCTYVPKTALSCVLQDWKAEVQQRKIIEHVSIPNAIEILVTIGLFKSASS